MLMETMVGMLTEEATIEMDISPIGVRWVLVTSFLELNLLIISLMKIVVRIVFMIDQNCGTEVYHEGLIGENDYVRRCQKEQLFYTKCKVLDKIVILTIDSGSQINVLI
ncbi:hypothetical protein M9H77_18459 [Catharanthus roseus]|uniref:Uncharacterized protein n=1 Tax=Catharanthus roseus TaxID=4058 RepID=A0ACC0B7J6_CATRO|nr:hypothetical protein M9H77_18459 [Catharanthus roseus]